MEACGETPCTHNLLQASNDTYWNPQVQKILREKPKFDVALLDPFIPDISIHMAKQVFDIPVILFFTSIQFPVVQRSMGNPIGHAYIPFPMLPLSQDMSFFQRMQNLLAVTGFFMLQGTRLSSLYVQGVSLYMPDKNFRGLFPYF